MAARRRCARIAIKIRFAAMCSRKKALAMSLLVPFGGLGAIAACTERGEVPVPGGGNNVVTAPEAGCEDKPVPAVNIPSLRSGQGAIPFQGIVIDSETGARIPNAVVTLEVGGVYLPYCDPSKGNPSYEMGGITGADGTFNIPVPMSVSSFGIHVFADGYLYGGNGKVGGNFVPLDEIKANRACWIAAGGDGGPDATVDGAACVAEGGVDAVAPKYPGYQVIPVVKIGPDQQGQRPIVTDVKVTPNPVPHGASFVLSANARAQAGPTSPHPDPMSDEVIFVELPGQTPTSEALPMACGELDPPSPGNPGGVFPDGIYSRTLPAPTSDATGKPCTPAVPCKYTYYVVSSTQGCVTSQSQSVTVQIQ
jgi:hypothetical protein